MELIVTRYGVRDSHEVESVEHGRRLAESLSDEGVAFPIMIVDGDTLVLSYKELMGEYACEHLPVDEAAIFEASKNGGA